MELELNAHSYRECFYSRQNETSVKAPLNAGICSKYTSSSMFNKCVNTTKYR